ncbi:MAG: DegQ family serine endoprotease [Gammaproteobacteria bacterium]|nr:DegQ family serine endoprotease [Gammaproteobacteria bacterium]MBQ0839776.1 DegQ family serine endoprotease [Gammaproteobacteria bacterium]
MVTRAFIAFCCLFAWVLTAHAQLPNFTQLIEENSAAVVKITARENNSSRRREAVPQGQIPDALRELFNQRRSPERKAHSMGSGFIISSDGYILTNNHVVGSAKQITVRLNDRREYEAEIVGLDPRSDLALLKIAEKQLPVVHFGEPDQLKVGEWVVAIGSPFGLDYSASTGIVSAIGRSIPTARGEDYVPFIQTDVAINPGNSGGPLFNLDGEVVGINSQIYTRSGGSIGLSFAIPVSVALEVVSQLKEKGRVDRGWLGVYIQDVDKNLAQSLGLKKPRGALLAQLEPDGPADKAGLKAGDVVIGFNGQAVVEASDLPHIVGLLSVGEEVDATVIRRGKKRTLSVEVGARPGDDRVAAEGGGDTLGLEVAELDAEALEKRRLLGGVVVVKVYPDSPAAEAGLQEGDVLAQLGYQTLNDVNDYEAILKQLPAGTPVALRFFRRGRSIFRTIEIK